MFEAFPIVKTFSNIVPVCCITPGVGRVIHRFFDTSPISPSGRYAALFRMSQERLRADVGLRVDPHPAWDRMWRYLVFNVYEGNTRRVFIADMSRFTGKRQSIENWL